MKFAKREFVKETLELDFNDFVDCSFRDCTLIYHGYGTFTLGGCSFHNVSWQFGGAASNTIAFLRGLYHGAGEGGRALVEGTFKSIRSPSSEA